MDAEALKQRAVRASCCDACDWPKCGCETAAGLFDKMMSTIAPPDVLSWVSAHPEAAKGLAEGSLVAVPKEVTLEMQHAYFEVVDANLPRVQTDFAFGRYASNQQAYRAMIAAASTPAPSDEAQDYRDDYSPTGDPAPKMEPSPSPSPASAEPINAADRERAKALDKGATPGPWEFDGIKTEGSYGSGDDIHEGFNEFQIIDTEGRQICSTEYRDHHLIEVRDEYDEESHSAWDELARRDAEFIAFSRTAIPAFEARVVELEAALAAARQEISDNEGTVAHATAFRDALDAQRARATALLEALRPFAEEAEKWSAADPSHEGRHFADMMTIPPDPEGSSGGTDFTLGDLRRACAAINAGASNDRK